MAEWRIIGWRLFSGRRLAAPWYATPIRSFTKDTNIVCMKKGLDRWTLHSSQLLGTQGVRMALWVVIGRYTQIND